MKAKKEIERALDGAIEEVYDLARQMGLGGISIQAHPDMQIGYGTAFEPDNTSYIYAFKRIDFEGEE